MIDNINYKLIFDHTMIIKNDSTTMIIQEIDITKYQYPIISNIVREVTLRFNNYESITSFIDILMKYKTFRYRGYEFIFERPELFGYLLAKAYDIKREWMKIDYIEKQKEKENND